MGKLMIYSGVVTGPASPADRDQKLHFVQTENLIISNGNFCLFGAFYLLFVMFFRFLRNFSVCLPHFHAFKTRAIGVRVLHNACSAQSQRAGQPRTQGTKSTLVRG